MRLKNRVAIVTGAKQGIGQGIAVRFAQEGAEVICADIGSCSETVELIGNAGGKAKSVFLDVTSEESWSDVVGPLKTGGSRIDILASVAGIVASGPDTATEISMEDWNRVIGIDMKGVFLGIRAVLPTMIEQKYGKLVNITSMAAIRGLPNLLAYSTAKGGVAAMTRQIAVTYAEHGITANAIAPGTIDTPILTGVLDYCLEQFRSAHAIHRLGKPSDIAALAAFLPRMTVNLLPASMCRAMADGRLNSRPAALQARLYYSFQLWR